MHCFHGIFCTGGHVGNIIDNTYLCKILITKLSFIIRVDSRDLQTSNINLKIPLFRRGGISEDLKSILITVWYSASGFFVHLPCPSSNLVYRFLESNLMTHLTTCTSVEAMHCGKSTISSLGLSCIGLLCISIVQLIVNKCNKVINFY